LRLSLVGSKKAEMEFMSLECWRLAPQAVVLVIANGLAAAFGG